MLGEHLVKAVASDTALAPASGSLARLQASIGSARTRELDETSRFVPPCADSVSGRTYRVDANSLGLQAFTLKWRTDHAGAMVLKLADRTLELPARADGKFARAKRPIDGIIPIARALWKQPCELVFELDLLGKIDHYMLDIKFAGNSAEIAIHERTGLMRERRHAEAR